MRKNILIFGHSYGPQFVDISNQYTSLFNKTRYEITVVYLIGNPDETIRLKHTADHVIFLNASKKAMRGLKIRLIQQMLKLTREKKFDIVICHRYKPSYIMLWVNLFCHIRALFFVMHELGTLQSLSRKLIIAGLARPSMLFAGVSNAVCHDMQRDIWRVPRNHVITLHNMIDVEFTKTHLLTKEIAREKLQIPANTFVFGNISRLAKNKDQKTLIQAFAAIKPLCPHATLIIIGDGVLEKELKKLVTQLSLSDSVIFAGFIPDGFRFMKAFDVFVLSSIQEAFGRVLLEAMVANIPVIATRVNGIPEVLGETGSLIPAGDIKILAEEMLTAYQASAEILQKTAKNGYDRAVQHFSLQKFNEIFWQLPLVLENKDKA